MGTKMKGILKGFRQISNIFDAKEQEMQIGFPTNVKHVAHIGWDGPLVDDPNPMNESQSTTKGRNELAVSAKRPPQDSAIDGGGNTSLPKDSPAKPSKRNTSSSAPNAEAATPSAVPKHSRRRQPRSVDCPSQESSEASRRGRRERKGSGSGSDSSTAVQDDAAPGPMKQPRRKKAARGPTGASVRPSRSKDHTAERAGPEQLPGPPSKPVNPGTEGGLV